MTYRRAYVTLGILLVASFHQVRLSAQEMAILASALDACAVDTTYYVALEALNDTADPEATPPYDYILDGGGAFVVRPWEGRFVPVRVNLLTGVNRWRGPYLNYQPWRTQTTVEPYDRGSPLDPWGTPYLFFSPLGLLRGDSGSVTLEFYGDTFDRYTLVSLGPDGLKSADDLVYAFGPAVTVFAISSLRGTQVFPVRNGLQSFSRAVSRDAGGPDYRAVAGSLLTIRGTNFGIERGTTRVFWGAGELTEIGHWSNREVEVTLPPNVTGTGALRLIRDLETTNDVLLEIVTYAAAADWMLYN